MTFIEKYSCYLQHAESYASTLINLNILILTVNGILIYNIIKKYPDSAASKSGTCFYVISIILGIISILVLLFSLKGNLSLIALNDMNEIVTKPLEKLSCVFWLDMTVLLSILLGFYQYDLKKGMYEISKYIKKLYNKSC